MIWFLEDLARVRRERQAVADLEGRSPARLANVAWRVDGHLSADADIVVDGTAFPVTLRYPHAFPHCPPSVLPRGATTRWSTHQYGRAGELCLEWGPDNWHPDVTGADMLESAYRLLRAEAASGGAASVRDELPSRHRTTLGQDLRWEQARFAPTAPLLAELRRLEPGRPVGLTAAILWHETAVAVFVTGLTGATGAWRDASVPMAALGFAAFESPGAAVRWPEEAAPPVLDGGIAALGASLAAAGIDLEPLAAVGAPLKFLLIAHRGRPPILVWLLNPETDVLSVLVTLPAPSDARPRLAPEFASLRGRSVGIVGCGSVGSKVATSLARSGVARFVLVDCDVVTAENLVRNDLDWRALGDDKADALSRRLALVNPAAICDARKAVLSGQEACSFTDTTLQALTDCDIVIDATADPACFTLLAGAVDGARRPMVWAEVFAGGIGGVVARHRPGRDPAPATMRRSILAWCAEQRAPWARPVGAYAAEDAEGLPLIADDGDVSVIAAHATRLAVDALLGRTPSAFPHSVYMVGLARGWVFGEPFETIPIDVGAPPPASDAADLETEEEALAFVAGLIEKARR